MAEAKEKRPKIRCGEMESGEAFTYKGGVFRVIRTFEAQGFSRVMVMKPRRGFKKKQSIGVPLGKGEIVSFNHGTMVRRYEPPVTFQ